MIRERALKIILVIVGLAFTAATYPVVMILWQRERSGYTDAMMGSIYIALGVFLLMAVRKPAEHQPHRLRWLVECSPRQCHGDYGAQWPGSA